jgi:ferric-dicitrate binding protein FerR (iron transport regulator)
VAHPDPNFLSWKTGILIFDQSPLSEVADHLKRIYGIEFHLDDGIPADLRFSSTINNQDLESVLEEMALVLDLDFDIGPESVSIFKTAD